MSNFVVYKLNFSNNFKAVSESFFLDLANTANECASTLNLKSSCSTKTKSNFENTN